MPIFDEGREVTDDARKHPRFEANLSIVVTCDGTRSDAHTCMISSGGLAIETTQSINTGALVDLSLPIQGEKNLGLTGIVVSQHPSGHHRHHTLCIALHFLDDISYDRWQAVVRKNA